MNTTSQPAVRGESVRPRADDVSSHREAIAPRRADGEVAEENESSSNS